MLALLSLCEQLFSVIVIALIMALVFWQRNIFLYILGCPVALVYGLSLASDSTQGSPLWVAGISVAIIGTYCLFKVAMLGLEELRSSRRKE